MAKSGKPSADDVDLFRRSIGPVRKLQQDKTGPVKKALSPRPRRQPQELDRALTDSFSDGFDPGEVSSDELLFFARSGLQQRQIQRLKRGQLQIGAELDLHGMTAAIARGALVNFIDLCRDRHIRTVHIIHGKGYSGDGTAPVLKNRMNNWLRQHHDVLAFSSATRHDGGSGALYVLLRTKQ